MPGAVRSGDGHARLHFFRFKISKLGLSLALESACNFAVNLFTFVPTVCVFAVFVLAHFLPLSHGTTAHHQDRDTPISNIFLIACVLRTPRHFALSGEMRADQSKIDAKMEFLQFKCRHIAQNEGQMAKSGAENCSSGTSAATLAPKMMVGCRGKIATPNCRSGPSHKMIEW